MSAPVPAPAGPPGGAPPARPRVGFLGVGWIGRTRMQALHAAGDVDAVAVADLDAHLREQAAADLGGASAARSLDELLDLDLDGVVIATPSALHAEQAVAALERGVAVFCQKPLGRDEAETRRVLDAARDADRLLAVDLSYRRTQALRAAQALIASGELGALYAADLVFHNAYGPDKPWFTQRELAGGGCLVDLGTHLIDLALWLTGSTGAAVTAAKLLRQGAPLPADPGSSAVEDFALAQLELDAGVTARVACSWFLPAGRECLFECTLYGTQGAVSVTNVDGSFYDFRAERHHGTTREALVEPPDEWGGRSVAAWGAQLAQGRGFDPAAEELAVLARVIDGIYGWRP
ncbi:MAG: gfo [Solirubrobacterales bacterium]|nr:gfo [Solirubrobacterales bacterium]